MPNFFYSLGYSLERVHSGMIAYLCSLWNEGKKEPLRSFLGYLGVSLENHGALRAVKEWKHIDLVIFDAEDNTPIVAIEMKVDGHEKFVKGEPQTVGYPSLLPPETPFLFVTLGAGEYFRTPYGERVRWIRIRDFHKALESISTFDSLVEDWKATIVNEIDLQDKCFSSDLSRIDCYRSKTWNLYFLGHLKEKLIESFSDRNISIDPTVYTAGSGPDTILNFGWTKLPAYMEVNNNGSLNLKIKLEGQTTERAKQKCFKRAQDYYQGLLKASHPITKTPKLRPEAKSKTIMSFDVALIKQGGHFVCSLSETETLRRLVTVLVEFYESPRFSE